MRILRKKIASRFLMAAAALVLGGCPNTNQFSSLTSCSGIGSCVSSQGDNPTGGSLGTGVTAKSPFYLTLKSYWEEDSSKSFPTSHSIKLIEKVNGTYLNTGAASDLSSDTCEIAASTAKTSAEEDRVITCGVTIPRAQLFFSKLDFKINVSDDADCDLVIYRPYGYFAGDQNATFTSRWQDTAIDCTGASPDNACYSGPMVDIPSFPDYSGLYHLIYDKSKDYSLIDSVDSANSKLRSDNRWTSYRPDGLPSGQNWSWRCIEKGDSLNYQITLRIIPIEDDIFNDGGPDHLGWLDENGDDRGLGNNQ